MQTVVQRHNVRGTTACTRSILPSRQCIVQASCNYSILKECHKGPASGHLECTDAGRWLRLWFICYCFATSLESKIPPGKYCFDQIKDVQTSLQVPSKGKNDKLSNCQRMHGDFPRKWRVGMKLKCTLFFSHFSCTIGFTHWLLSSVYN